MRRGGELLAAINGQQSGLKQNRGGGAPTTMTQRQAAAAAGIDDEQPSRVARLKP